jgi:hypothetical protein
MNNPHATDHLIAQGRALVRAIEALGTIERLDAEIDALVYGLTEEEIATVEERSKRLSPGSAQRQG